jgi:hypothetical protein
MAGFVTIREAVESGEQRARLESLRRCPASSKMTSSASDHALTQCPRCVDGGAHVAADANEGEEIFGGQAAKAGVFQARADFEGRGLFRLQNLPITLGFRERSAAFTGPRR